MKSYTLNDVVRVADATAPTVRGWLRQSVLTADVAPPGGRGKHRRFSFVNLVEARVVSRLHHQWNMPPAVLRQSVLMLRLIDPRAGQTRLADVWDRILNPSSRRPNDGLFLLLSPHFPGGEQLIVTEESRGSSALGMEMLVDMLVLDVRAAIEETETITGDNWYTIAPEQRRSND